MPYRPTHFRTTVIKPYYTAELPPIVNLDTINLTINVEPEPKVQKRGRGRPRKNAIFLITKEKSNYNLLLKLR